METRWTALLGLLCTSCGTYTHHIELAPDWITPYVDALQTVCLGGYPVRFEQVMELPGQALATCERNVRPYQTTRVVRFDNRVWTGMDEDARLRLVAHVLGHCWFGAGHTEGDGQLMSIYFNYATRRDTLDEFKQFCN